MRLQTIVHSTAALKYYPRLHMDAATICLLKRCVPVTDSKSDARKALVGLLDCYLGLTGQSIAFLSLSKRTINDLMCAFVGALNCKTFMAASDITRGIFITRFSKALEAMSAEVPNLIYEFDQEASLRLWSKMEICPLQVEYYQGWRLRGKTGSRGRDLRLAWVWQALGPEAARAIHAAASKFAERYEIKSQNNFVPVFNEFLKYLERECPEATASHLGASSFTTDLVEGFCRDFIEQKLKARNCLETTIKRWNDALPFLEATLLNSGVFAKPHRKFPYITPSRKTGADTKISMNANGVLVKDKLIVDVPLTLTDDEVIELLFEKIDRHVDAVTTWAHRQANCLVSRFEKNGRNFDHMDFDLTPKQIQAKYRALRLKKGRTAGIAYNLGLPTSYSLEPFLYLLINEHPNITESFLLGLELLDHDGGLIGVERTDACSYLVGYKRRRGGKKSAQRISLSENSAWIVEHVIKVTEPLRNYLKAKGDDSYRYLFLSCRTGFAKPQRVSDILHKTSSAAFKARIRQFAEFIESSDETNVDELVLRLSPSRFRATVGLQVFLRTGSAEAMSQALGHAKYKPDLLSHYLPEPILSFFQSRWIRLFQKGIVCKAMRDSSFLLRASQFKSIEDLDRFMRNHALSIPEDFDGALDRKMTGTREVLISVDENILAALLSLEEAVSVADQRMVSAKARYWSRFSALLQTEIENNTYDPDLRRALEVARTNVNPVLMRGLVHSQNSNAREGN